MNQKNIFSATSILLMIWSVSFYLMGKTIAVDTYPGIDEIGIFAVSINAQLGAMFIMIVALVMWAGKNSPEVLGAFTLGVGLLAVNTLKHYFIDDVYIPVVAIIFQWVIAILFAILWFRQNSMDKKVTSKVIE